jgi:hypothetical protein
MHGAKVNRNKMGLTYSISTCLPIKYGVGRHNRRFICFCTFLILLRLFFEIEDYELISTWTSSVCKLISTWTSSVSKLISTWTSSVSKLAKDIPVLSWSEFECDMQVAGRGTQGHKNKTNGE